MVRMVVGIEISNEAYEKLLDLKMRLRCADESETVEKLCDSALYALEDGGNQIHELINSWRETFEDTKNVFVDVLRQQLQKIKARQPEEKGGGE